MPDDAEPKQPEETPAAETPQEEPKAEETKAPEAPQEEKKEETPKAADAPKEEPKAEEEKEKDEEKSPQTAEEVFLSLEGGEDKPKILRAKGSKNVHAGLVHVRCTYNNTIVTITDLNGNVIGWSSAGKMGFRGSRKSTAYAAQIVSQDACRQAMGHGLKTVEVRVKGPGSGRDSAVRAVQNIGIEITSIRDVTPVPHNGCRPKKPRRV